jgi:hypothetical protein
MFTSITLRPALSRLRARRPLRSRFRKDMCAGTRDGGKLDGLGVTRPYTGRHQHQEAATAGRTLRSAVSGRAAGNSRQSPGVSSVQDFSTSS